MTFPALLLCMAVVLAALVLGVNALAVRALRRDYPTLCRSLRWWHVL